MVIIVTVMVLRLGSYHPQGSKSCDFYTTSAGSGLLPDPKGLED